MESLWQADINSKSSTKHISPKALIVGKCHHIWSTVRNNIHNNRRAQFKCKLLTGTYILQANRAAFNQYSVNPTCKLCSKEPETREHFIAKCDFYDCKRNIYKKVVVYSWTTRSTDSTATRPWIPYTVNARCHSASCSKEH